MHFFHCWFFQSIICVFLYFLVPYQFGHWQWGVVCSFWLILCVVGIAVYASNSPFFDVSDFSANWLTNKKQSKYFHRCAFELKWPQQTQCLAIALNEEEEDEEKTEADTCLFLSLSQSNNFFHKLKSILTPANWRFARLQMKWKHETIDNRSMRFFIAAYRYIRQ